MVMPIKEFEKIENLEECYKITAKEIGFIGYENENFKIIKKAKISKMVDFNYKLQMMDRIIRGFHKGGVNARKSYR